VKTMRRTYAESDALLIPLHETDARWLLEEVTDLEQQAVELLALRPCAEASGRLARVRALKLELEEQLGIDHVVRRPFVPVEDRQAFPAGRWTAGAQPRTGNSPMDGAHLTNSPNAVAVVEPEPALSGAVREGNGKCGATHEEPAALDGQDSGIGASASAHPAPISPSAAPDLPRPSSNHSEQDPTGGILSEVKR